MNQRECERLGPALSAHAAGEPETAELGEHLAGCAACRRTASNSPRIWNG